MPGLLVSEEELLHHFQEFPSSPRGFYPNSPRMDASLLGSSSLARFLPSNHEDPSPPPGAAVYSSDDFRMFEFKVRRCMRGRSHDWTECPFAHPGEKARRRDPRRFHYGGAACPDFRKGHCRSGDSCELSHGVFECWLHPARYRTQPCKDGRSCKRRVCFFAHTPEQLRLPMDFDRNRLQMGEISGNFERNRPDFEAAIRNRQDFEAALRSRMDFDVNRQDFDSPLKNSPDFYGSRQDFDSPHKNSPDFYSNRQDFDSVLSSSPDFFVNRQDFMGNPQQRPISEFDALVAAISPSISPPLSPVSPESPPMSPCSSPPLLDQQYRMAAAAAAAAILAAPPARRQLERIKSMPAAVAVAAEQRRRLSAATSFNGNMSNLVSALRSLEMGGYSPPTGGYPASPPMSPPAWIHQQQQQPRSPLARRVSPDYDVAAGRGCYDSPSSPMWADLRSSPPSSLSSSTASSRIVNLPESSDCPDLGWVNELVSDH